MKRMAIMVFAALLGSALVFSAAATAKPGTDKEARKLAKQQCKAEKRADKQAFKATYGKRAMRTCTKGEKSEVKDELRNAAKQCKAEREADRDAFKETYGSNSNKKNALGKCVSSKVKAEMEAAEG